MAKKGEKKGRSARQEVGECEDTLHDQPAEGGRNVVNIPGADVRQDREQCVKGRIRQVGVEWPHDQPVEGARDAEQSAASQDRGTKIAQGGREAVQHISGREVLEEESHGIGMPRSHWRDPDLDIPASGKSSPVESGPPGGRPIDVGGGTVHTEPAEGGREEVDQLGGAQHGPESPQAQRRQVAKVGPPGPASTGEYEPVVKAEEAGLPTQPAEGGRDEVDEFPSAQHEPSNPRAQRERVREGGRGKKRKAEGRQG